MSQDYLFKVFGKLCFHFLVKESLFNESTIKNLSFRNQNQITEFHGKMSKSAEPIETSKYFWFILRRNYEIGLGECEIHFAFSSFKLQRTALNHRECFVIPANGIKDIKGLAAVRRGPFTLGGVRLLHEVPEEESLLALGFCGQGRWVNDDWHLEIELKKSRWKNKSSWYRLTLWDLRFTRYDFLICNTGFKMENWTTKILISWRYVCFTIKFIINE